MFKIYTTIYWTLILALAAFSPGLWATVSEANCLRQIERRLRQINPQFRINQSIRGDIRRFCGEVQSNLEDNPWYSCIQSELENGPLSIFKDARYVCHPAFERDQAECVRYYLANDPFLRYHNDYLSFCKKIPTPQARNCVRGLVTNHQIDFPSWDAEDICKRRTMRERECLIDYVHNQAPFGSNSVIRNRDDAQAYCGVSHPKDRECVLKALGDRTVSTIADAITLCSMASREHAKCEQIFLEWGLSYDLRTADVCRLPNYELRSCMKEKLVQWKQKNYSHWTQSYPPLPERNFSLFVLHCNIYEMNKSLTTGLYSPSEFACEFFRTENLPADARLFGH